MDLKFVLDLMTAWGTLIAALVAVFSAYVAHRTAAATNASAATRVAVELLHKLDDKYDGDRMHNFRRNSAVALLKALENNQPVTDNDDVEQVAGFFEAVGYYVERGIIEEEMIWNFFSRHIVNRYELSKEYIIAERSKKADTSYLEYFEKLARRMIAVEIEMVGRKPSMARDVLIQYLRDESKLQPSGMVKPEIPVDTAVVYRLVQVPTDTVG